MPSNGQHPQTNPQDSALYAQSPAARRAHPITCCKFYICHHGLSQRTKRVVSADEKTTFYTFVQNRGSGSNFGPTPHVRIYMGEVSADDRHKEIHGAINLDGNTISLHFVSQPRILMSCTGSMTTRKHEYKSFALPGSTLTWKKDGTFSRGDWACEDQDGNVVAKLKKTGFSISKTGTFELGKMVEDAGEAAILEIVAGGIALIELRKKQDLESRGNVEGGSAC